MKFHVRVQKTAIFVVEAASRAELEEALDRQTHADALHDRHLGFTTDTTVTAIEEREPAQFCVEHENLTPIKWRRR